MVEKTTISLSKPTRDLVREVKPLGMAWDEFVLELVSQYNPGTHDVDLDEEDYSQVVLRLIEAHDVDKDEVAIDLMDLDSADDTAPISS